MNYREKAEEFFEIILKRKKSLIEIPLSCTQGEVGALLYLTFVKDKITHTELSNVLDVSMPRVVALVNSLEKKQLIKRVVDKDDKRKIIICITKTGQKKVLKKKEEVILKIVKIIEQLDKKDIDEYILLAKKISNIINKIK